MTGIVLSASVRQNLLSLQSTSQLLATTQNDLATGNKVNSALDNPTNYFTASALNSRASDISSLLDSVGNGVQVLQAANTGITSLQSLISSAKSIATQALQSTSGYSTKSNYSTTITGASADDLRGSTIYSNTVATGNVLKAGDGSTALTSSMTLGGAAGSLVGPTAVGTATSTTTLDTLTALTNGSTITVNGKTITINTSDNAPSSATPGSQLSTDGQISTDANGNSTVYVKNKTGTAAGTIGDLLNAIDLASGDAVEDSTGAITAASGTATDLSSIDGTSHKITLKSSTGADLNVSASANVLNALGLTTSTGTNTVSLNVARTASASTIGTLVQDGATLNVDGKTITFKNAAKPGATALATGSTEVGNLVTDGNGNSTVYLQGGTVADALNAIDLATGAQKIKTTGSSGALEAGTGAASTVSSSGALQINTGTAADLSISGTGNALAALGLTGNTGTAISFTASRASSAGSLDGKTLNFSAFAGGTAASITFGDGTNGTVKSLNDLNDALAADNLMASLDSGTGKLTISTTNDYASHTLGGTDGGVISGTATDVQTFTSAEAPVADSGSQSSRASLVTQYNNILNQIMTTAQDASFNGVNLLNGDQLKLVFNETGTSTLNIQGNTDDPTSLGLSNLTQGADFLDNAATNKVMDTLTSASSTLAAQASTLGSNLSVVQIRQQFSTSMINVLQTGASNLTLADPNELAADSQALSTRQSIAVSALALANQSQQSVLQLLQG
jgi:flagellin-like hook-associated protein FlgL